MSKNIKKVISMVMAFAVISAALPASKVNLLNLKAYASSDDNDNDEEYLDSLDLYDEDGDIIKLYSDSNYKDKVASRDIEESTTYYAKASSDTVSIEIEGPDDKYVRIFNGTNSSSKGVEVGDDIDLSQDSETTTLTIKVLGKAPSGDIRYRDVDDYDVLNTYRIKVENTQYDPDTKSSNIYLKRLSVSGNKVNLSNSELEYTINVDKDKKYVDIRATPEDEDYDVTIDNKRVYSSDNFIKTVALDQGTNQFQIKLEDGDKEKNYLLTINRGEPTKTDDTIADNSDASSYDKIYLSKLSLSGRSLNLSNDVVNYTEKLSSDTDKVTITAEPEKDSYTVKVNNQYVDESDDYKIDVKLLMGNNPIKVEINNGNGNEKRVYTLNVIRGEASSTNTNSNATTNNSVDSNNANKANQWVQVNGNWQYNDASGNPVRNTWIGNYYLLYNGNMATGWLNYNGSWYYLGTDGAIKTGWQKVDSNWYYLDSQGKIQTGWLNYNGKYYYLNSYGAMAYNTVIDGYKIDENGVWVK